MITKPTRLDPEIVAAWQEISEAYENLPEDVPPPETPEAIEAMVKLLTTVYGDALRELAKN